MATTAINTRDHLDGFILNTSAARAAGATTDGQDWKSVSTSVVLPTAANTVWIAPPLSTGGGGGLVQFVLPAGPFKKNIELGSTIGLYVGKGCALLRGSEACPQLPRRCSHVSVCAGLST